MTRNHMSLTFPSLAENESFARVAIAAFAVQLIIDALAFKIKICHFISSL